MKLKMDQKHSRQRRFQEALTRFQVEESAHLLDHLNQFLTRNSDAHKAREEKTVKQCSMRRHYLASLRLCSQKTGQALSVQECHIKSSLQKTSETKTTATWLLMIVPLPCENLKALITTERSLRYKSNFTLLNRRRDLLLVFSKSWPQT